MTATENTGNNTHRRDSLTFWLRLAVTFLICILISFGLSYLLQRFIAKLNFPLYDFAWLAYLTVFGITLVANMTIMVPVPVAMSTMIAGATKWNPILIALSASIGGSIGELSGYYAGYLGKRIAMPKDVLGYRRYEHWILRYGIWAIFFLAVQPILPFDIGGFIAGTARMPIRKFLPALWAGKVLKYIILTWAGTWLLNYIPFLPQ